MSRMTSMAGPQDADVIDRSGQTAPHTQPIGRKPFTLKLWLPLTPLWIMLAPFALILAPLLTLIPPVRTIAPYRAAAAIGSVLLSLSGTVVEINSSSAVVRIRIF
jgi:hypothetical protein